MITIEFENGKKLNLKLSWFELGDYIKVPFNYDQILVALDFLCFEDWDWMVHNRHDYLDILNMIWPVFENWKDQKSICNEFDPWIGGLKMEFKYHDNPPKLMLYLGGEHISSIPLDVSISTFKNIKPAPY